MTNLYLNHYISKMKVNTSLKGFGSSFRVGVSILWAIIQVRYILFGVFWHCLYLKTKYGLRKCICKASWPVLDSWWLIWWVNFTLSWGTIYLVKHNYEYTYLWGFVLYKILFYTWVTRLTKTLLFLIWINLINMEACIGQ